jgi:hypothetical protein
MAGGVAHRASALQGASPEFKPQYHKKKKGGGDQSPL